MGAGIRVISGEKTGYAYSDDLSMEKLKETARVAAFIAGIEDRKIPVNINSSKTSSDYYKINIVPDNITAKKKIELLRHSNSSARDYSSEIKAVSVRFDDTNKKIIIANSDGLYMSDVQVQSSLMTRVNAIKGEKRSSAYAYKRGTLGFENYNMEIADEIAQEACRIAEAMLPAEDAPAGEYPIVMKKGSNGLFFHECIGHSLEGDNARKKRTCFWDKVNKQIASEITSIADDGTVKGSRGSVNIDDEGTPGQNNILIEKGYLKTFMYDKLSAKLMGKKPTGNGRRQSYKYYPQARMTNTYLLPGTDNPEDIVKTVKKGMYIARIGYGNVNSTTGRFVFNVSEGYLIENGQITKPLKGIMLMGNGPDVLKNITHVGNDLEILGQGTCGKGGQWKEVSYGNPTLKVSKITIGGSRV